MKIFSPHLKDRLFHTFRIKNENLTIVIHIEFCGKNSKNEKTKNIIHLIIDGGIIKTR